LKPTRAVTRIGVCAGGRPTNAYAFPVSGLTLLTASAREVALDDVHRAGERKSAPQIQIADVASYKAS
jgi:hypothetical protein